MQDDVKYLKIIRDSWTKEEFPAKCLLVKKGARSKKLYFICQGSCRCWFNEENGKEVTMNFDFEGSFVSSIETIISNEPSWYNVETMEPTVVYSMALAEFQKRKECDRELEHSYWSHIENRLLHYQKLFVGRIKNSPEKRYRELIAQQPEIIRRVPLRFIASFLGITTVSLSRIRSRK